MAMVKFLPSEVEVDLGPEETLLQAAKAAGVPVGSVCGGLGNCTGCRVRVLEGEEHLSPMGFKERERLGNTFFITKERLACQTRVTGPMTVEVLEEQPRDKRGRARKRALDRTLENAQRRAARKEQREAADAARRRSPRPKSPADAVPRQADPASSPEPARGEAAISASAPEDRPRESSGEEQREGQKRSRRRRRRRRRRSPRPERDVG